MTYNGHKNWSHWNVSLWLSNDEGLYNLARSYTRRSMTKDEAARCILRDLQDMGHDKTPDNASYSFSSIRAAISGDF